MRNLHDFVYGFYLSPLFPPIAPDIDFGRLAGSMCANLQLLPYLQVPPLKKVAHTA